MEKRKAIGLQSYFSRSLLFALFGVLAIISFALFMLNLLIGKGYILPANNGETTARLAMNQLKSGQEPVQLNADHTYDYIEFAADGEVISSSLDKNARKKLLARYPEQTTSYPSAAYLILDDGTYWLFSWNYKAQFTNPILKKYLPPVSWSLIGFTLVALLLFFVFYVRHMSRKFRVQLDIVKTASQQIAQQELDKPIETATGLKEFDDTLAAVEHMRQALKLSLADQWRAEQQRKEQIAALAHDIKTPLTVISGNAELLAEDPLNPLQVKLVDSTLQASVRAKDYISLLQQLATDAAGEALEEFSVHTLLQELAEAIEGLAQQKQINLRLTAGELPKTVKLYHSMLLRALINIAENAIRYTPVANSITILTTCTAHTMIFSIQDSGPGFSPDALNHATEMFWQADKSRTGTGNYGMGLALAVKAAKAHSGDLQIENTETGGRVTLKIQL